MSPPCTLLTGASSDIGRELALHLAPGRRLILGGRDRERLEAVRQACPEPSTHRIWHQDLEQADQLEASLGDLLRREDLQVEHFVHGAGRLEVAPLRLLDPARISALFQVNLFAAMEITRHLSRRRFNGDSLRSVLFISSIAARVGTPGFSAYAASKGALGALCRSLAVELAPSVRVNCVLPGGILTRGTAALLQDPETRDGRSLLGPGQAGDVAGVAAFLVSEEARWITGQEFVVDGGSSIH
jgi:NAD(P)-dependent dehydrogenase (short-subunit alcohol dehydrogenase family)